MPFKGFEDLFHYLQITHTRELVDGVVKRIKTQVRIDPEDVIAFGGVLVAIIFAITMVIGAVPINKYTTAIVGLSGIGAVIAKITKARNRKPVRTPWIERIVIVALLTAFGIYVWLSWGWVSH